MDGELREFYNEIYRRNPSKWSANTARDGMAFLTIMSTVIKEPGSVLDVGCGNGHTLEFFKSEWPNVEYTGVDISDVALDLAKRRVPGGMFIQELPNSGEWNIILIMGVAEHFEHPIEELRKIGKLLSPNGLIYLEVPNCIAYSPDKTEGFRKTNAGSDQSEWHWRRDTWKQAIQDAGLEIVKNYSGLNYTWQYIWILRKGR